MRNIKTAPKKLEMFYVTCSQINQYLSHVPNFILVDKNISEPNITIDKYEVHFADVGKILASHLNSTDNYAFLRYLKSPYPFSAYLYPTSPQELVKLLKNLKLNIACSYDDISLF